MIAVAMFAQGQWFESHQDIGWQLLKLKKTMLLQPFIKGFQCHNDST
jgi:hypothetical protein